MKSSPVHLMLFIGTLNVHAAEPDFASAPNSPLKLASGGHNFILGDANGDRKPDLFVCGGTALTVLLGNGLSAFR